MQEHAIAYELMTHRPTADEFVKEKDALRVLDIDELERRILQELTPEPIEDSQRLLKAYGLQRKEAKVLPTLFAIEELAPGPLPASIYNSAMTAFIYAANTVSNGKPDVGTIVEVVKRMQLLNVKPTIETFETLALVSCRMGELDSAFDILKDVRKNNLKPSTTVGCYSI